MPATAFECRDVPVALPEERGLGTSVGKALAVLDSFREGGVLLGVSQVAERAKIAKSTAHRLLSVLVERGYVERVDVRYRLGRAAFELGNMVAECRPRNLRSVAIPYMTDLHRRFDATVHLAVLDRTDVLYVEKIYGHRAVEVPSQIGGRVPALCTALGKAMLAFSSDDTQARVLSAPVPRLTVKTMTNATILHNAMGRARQTGVAYDNEGSSLGVLCVAAPILRPLDESSAQNPYDVVGAISMSFPLSERVSSKLERELAGAAAAISRTCG